MQQQQPPQQARPHAQPPAGAMSNPASDEIIYQGTMKQSASYGGYLKWFLASVAGGAAAYGLGQIEFFANLGLPYWVLGFIGVPGMLWTFLRHITTKFKITVRRVEFERGVLSKDVDSLELWRVLDVRYKQTLIDRILGNARIILISTDKSDPELELYGLPKHRQHFEQLREAVQAARHTSRPMELVGQDGGFEDVGAHM